MDDFAEWKMTGYFRDYHGSGGGCSGLSQRGSVEHRRILSDFVFSPSLMRSGIDGTGFVSVFPSVLFFFFIVSSFFQ